MRTLEKTGKTQMKFRQVLHYLLRQKRTSERKILHVCLVENYNL